MGRKDAATEFRNKALEKANAVAALLLMGASCRGKRNRKKRSPFIAPPRRSSPTIGLSHVGLARVYSGQGDFDKAVKEMQAALPGVPDDANKSRLKIT